MSQVLNPAFSLHPINSLDMPGVDRDDDAEMGDDDARLFSKQESFDHSLATSSVIAGFASGSSTENAGSRIQVENLQGTPELLATTGWGTARLVGIAAAAPAASASRSFNQDHEPSLEDKERQAPPLVPESSPLDISPPDALRDDPSPAFPPIMPFATYLPIDTEAIQRSADILFEQLAQLSEQWNDRRIVERLLPWVAAAGVVAYEWVCLRWLRSFPVLDSEENSGPVPACLLRGKER
jgi:hypothetical protein